MAVNREQSEGGASRGVRFILGVVLLACGVMLVLALLYPSETAFFLNLKGFCYGTAGSLAIGVGIIVVWMGAMLVFSTGRPVSIREFALIVPLYLCTLAIINLLSHTKSDSMMEFLSIFGQKAIFESNPTSFLSSLKSSYFICRNQCCGGGWLGTLLAYPAWKLGGTTIGVTLVAVLAIILIILLFKIDIKGITQKIEDNSHRRSMEREKSREEKEHEQMLLEAEQQRQAAEQQRLTPAYQRKAHMVPQAGAQPSPQPYPPQNRQQPYPQSRQQPAPQPFAQPNAQVPASHAPNPQPHSDLPPWLMQNESTEEIYQNRAAGGKKKAAQPKTAGNSAPNPNQPRMTVQERLEGTRRAVREMGEEDFGAIYHPATDFIEPDDMEWPSAPEDQKNDPFDWRDDAVQEDVIPISEAASAKPKGKKKAAVSNPYASGKSRMNGSEAVGNAPYEEDDADDGFYADANPFANGDSASGNRFYADSKAYGSDEPTLDSDATPYANGGTAAGNHFYANNQAYGSDEPAIDSLSRAASVPKQGTGKSTSPKNGMQGQPIPLDFEDGDDSLPEPQVQPKKPSPRSPWMAQVDEALEGSYEVENRPGKVKPTQSEAKPVKPKASVANQGASSDGKRKMITSYVPPRDDLLSGPSASFQSNPTHGDLEKAEQLERTLKSFGIPAKVENFTHGPAVTRFELSLQESGINVKRIQNLDGNIAMDMASNGGVRIEIPIPGTNLFGIEVPHQEVEGVKLSEVLFSPEMKKANSPLTVALGKDISGRPVLCDLGKMPHLLIAGQTGSGKSVCINTIINSLIYRVSPQEVRFIMIDPKVVELQCYNGIPHLLAPVVSDPHKAAGILTWVVGEMLDRYNLMSHHKARNIAAYNDSLPLGEPKLPRIVLIIDELSDLMMACRKEVEDKIVRIAQLSRAAGIHMVLATQRPTADVITGLIKANVPSRIAFAVASSIDSRTILDQNGAEKLLGRGDMFYFPTGAKSPMRVQGCFLSDNEIERIVEDVKKQGECEYDENVVNAAEKAADTGNEPFAFENPDMEGTDPLLPEAIALVMENNLASVSMLQRRMSIGHPRAGRLMDAMHERGIVGPDSGSKPREILITKDEYERIKETLK